MTDPITTRHGLVPGTRHRVKFVLQSPSGGTFYDPVRDQADQDMALQVGKELHTAYPGYYWAVLVDSKQGIVSIWIPTLMEVWRYNIPLNKADLTPAVVKKAGGEILERFGLKRGHMDVDQYAEVRAKAPPRPDNKVAPGEPVPEPRLPRLVLDREVINALENDLPTVSSPSLVPELTADANAPDRPDRA